MPSTLAQLGMLLLFLLPGVVLQSTRGRLTGPTPDDASALGRSVRALAVSAALMMIYAWTFGPRLLPLLARAQADDVAEMGADLRELAAWAFLLLVAAPAVLAVAWKHLTSMQLLQYWALRLFRITYSPTPRAWDFAFTDLESRFVRILTTDGRYLGGWFAEGSFVSSFPEPREIFLSRAYHMEPDGRFGEEVSQTNGIYIRCDDVRSVELLDVPVVEAHPESEER